MLAVMHLVSMSWAPSSLPELPPSRSPPCCEVGTLVTPSHSCGRRGPGCPGTRPVAPRAFGLCSSPWHGALREHTGRGCSLFPFGLWAKQEAGRGCEPHSGMDEPEARPGGLQRSPRKPTSAFFQDPREPGSCRMHTGSKPPQHSETNAAEFVVPGGQQPAAGSPCLAAPAEGRPAGAARRGQGDLQCPHCLRCFSDKQGEELFRHVAECCL